MWRDELISLFLNKKIKFYQFADFSEINSMKLGGKISLLVEPEDIDRMIFAFCSARKFGVPVSIVGGMTNTLPPDGIFDGVVIRTARIGTFEYTENNGVHADCGASIGAISRGMSERGIGGFAELAGIPGTIGGALYGNAGAYGVSISDRVIEVDVYDLTRDSKRVLSPDDIGYGYRDSLFKRDDRYLILSAKLQGYAAECDHLKEKIAEYARIRRKKQPLSMPSLGSVFKHPSGDFAPRLIESLGLKGFRIGGAEVSTAHAGFIVNRGTATSRDVKDVIATIKKRVYDAYGIELEEEINYLM